MARPEDVDRRLRALPRGPVRRARVPPAPPGAQVRRGAASLAAAAVLLTGAVGLHGSAAAPGAGLRGAALPDPSGAPGPALPGVPSQAGARTATATSTSAGRPGTRPADVTVVAAGDIACPPGLVPTAQRCRQEETSDLALRLRPDAVLPLGDNAYETGTRAEFEAGYRPTWGRLDRIAHPVPGNHEYGFAGDTGAPSGAAGYFGYFGARSHPLQPGCRSGCDSWYSFDLGGWHLVALDSQCAEVGGCAPGDRQYEWLVQDLKAHAGTRCVLAYWHIPVFSSSVDHQPDMEAVYRLLRQEGVEVVLNGHGHFYERFAPQDETGRADPLAPVQFVVGTGGRSFFPVLARPAANSRALIADTFGVLRMTLQADGYRWAFETIGGKSRDRGAARCH